MDFSPGELVVLYLAWYGWGAVYTSAMALVGTAARAHPREISVGMGPGLLGFPISEVQFSLRLIAFGSSVRFPAPDEFESEGTAPVRSLRSLPSGVRAAISFSGPVACAVLGLSMLLLSRGRVLEAAALIGLFNGVLNVLPIPPLSGFLILAEMLPFLRGRDLNEVLPQGALFGGLMFILWGLLTFHTYLVFEFERVHDYVEAVRRALGIRA